MIEIGQLFTWRGNSNYTYCTGHEGTSGICWWCGQTHNKKTQCCSSDHKQEYLRHFDWRYAAEWALKRAGGDGGYRYHITGTCQDCGQIFNGRELEVHHIVPINGGKRFYSVLNCPCNLIVLCLTCHNKTKRKPRPYCQEIMELKI